MGLDRDTLRQIGLALKPLRDRVANAIARGVVHLASDGKKLQLLQVGVLSGETIDDAEHFQQYGFSSVPLAGAECVLVFPNGDRSHPLVIATGDRSSRPTGGKGGEVVMYTDEGDAIRLGRGHVVSVETVGTVKLGSSSAHDGAIKGTQRNTAEQTFLIAMNAYITAIQAVADPSGSATTTLTAAINVFKTAVASAVSAKVFVE